MKPKDHIAMGKVTSPYGVKGWVKVFSYTDPLDNLLAYPVWSLFKNGSTSQWKVATGKKHGKGLIVQFETCNDRSIAEQLCGSEVLVGRDELPELPPEEYYWHQLEGLGVYHAGSEAYLGVVHHMMETGSNDVLVVRPVQGSVDDRERLIPYLPEQVVKTVDLQSRRLLVDWDLDF